MTIGSLYVTEEAARIIVIALLCIGFSIATAYAVQQLVLPSIIPHMVYGDMREIDSPTIFMTLDEFKKIYIVNPDAYTLNNTTVWRKHNDEMYIIGFKGLDFHRYKHWRKVQSKMSDHDKFDAKYREFMMQVVQDDVDMIAKKANAELDRSRELLLQSMENNRNQGLEL